MSNHNTVYFIAEGDIPSYGIHLLSVTVDKRVVRLIHDSRCTTVGTVGRYAYKDEEVVNWPIRRVRESACVIETKTMIHPIHAHDVLSKDVPVSRLSLRFCDNAWVVATYAPRGCSPHCGFFHYDVITFI